MKSPKKLFLITLLFILTYLSTFLWMWDRWFARDSYYSHGVLVPLVTLVLIWQKRNILQQMKSLPSPWGVRIFSLGILFHLIGLLFRIYFLSGFSMIIVICGFILSVYGRAVLRQILFPLLFLIFMVPLPLVAVINISFQLKLLSAQLATFVLNGIGIQAVQEGSYIHMAHAKVVVEDVCSGLRSIISLMALGAVFAHGMPLSLFRKVLLIVLTIPIAVVTNTIRIVFLSFIGEIWGTQYLNGMIHGLSGFLVFGLAFFFLYILGKILK